MNSQHRNEAEWDLLRARARELRRAPHSRLQLVILLSLAAFLIWGVISRSLFAYLADAYPEEAVRFGSANPAALVNLAATKLKPGQAASAVPQTDGATTDLKTSDITQGANSSENISSAGPAKIEPQDQIRIVSWAERVLREDPLNARAFRILGQLSSDDQQRTKFMQAAARRSPRESVAVYWMMRKSYDNGDYSAAIRYADILLATRPGVAEHVMPILGKIAEHERASGELYRLLATNPRWRREFFDRLPANISDARTPLEIMLNLKNSPVPPVAADLSSYLKLLISERFFELAYYTWLQFLPSEDLARAGLLFNGDFEVAPSGLPFDWQFIQGSGVTISVAERPDRTADRALVLDFAGDRVDSLGVEQLITLVPGRYRLEGKSDVDVVSQRGLQWRISCLGESERQIGESSVAHGSGLGWKDFAISFSVPESGCPAQAVRLAFDARWASEQFISGSTWFDDLKIVRENASTQ